MRCSLRRVLVVSWGMPPTPAGSAVIVGNLARVFTRETMVLAGERPEKRVPEDWDADGPQLVTVESPWSRSGQGRHETRLLGVPWMTSRLTRLIRERGCTDVLAVYPDEAYLWAALNAGRRTGCRFYPYFHNTYLESRCGWRLRLARWLQPRVFQAARHVFVMSQGMVELYRNRYPDLANCSALVHSFAEDVPPFADPLKLPDRPFVLSGNINPSCSDAARRLAEAVDRVPGVRLEFYTGQTQAELERLGVWSRGASCRRLGRKELLKALRQAELLLLPHAFQTSISRFERETIFPTRTVEYLISGRPILAHTPPGAFLTRFLKEYDCALVVEEPDREAIRDGIERLQDPELRARIVRNALRTASMFHVSNVSSHLRAVLES